MKIHFEFHPNPFCMTVHTNVDVNEIRGLREYIENIEGVEVVEHGLSWEGKQFSDRYNFSVTRGKLFKWNDIQIQIIKLLRDVLSEDVELIKELL